MALNPPTDGAALATAQYQGNNYSSSDAYKQALAEYNRLSGGDTTRANHDVGGYASTIQNLFTQLVGRAPSADEFNQVFSNVVGTNINPSQRGDTQNYQTNSNLISDQAKQYLSDNFQKQAQDQTQTALQGQVDQASQLSDMFRTQGRQAINDTKQQLLDYANSVIERVRPQLLTSLHAQGLDDTGGLNVALADMVKQQTNAASGYLSDAYMNNENQANQIKFSGAAAPYQFGQSQIMNQVPYLQSGGQSALERNYQNYMTNVQFGNQVALMNRQAMINEDMKPTLLSNFGQSYAGAAGSNLGTESTTSPWTAMGKSGMGGGMGQAGGGAMMSSKTFKKNIQRLSEAEEDALYDRFVAMPLNRYHYKDQQDNEARHLGVVTEETMPELVTPDGKHLSTVDYIGMLTLTAKVLNRRLLAKKAA